jgi:AhpD family alkylhydroperoxidase
LRARKSIGAERIDFGEEGVVGPRAACATGEDGRRSSNGCRDGRGYSRLHRLTSFAISHASGCAIDLSARLFGMSTERKEPTYLFTDKQVADQSEIARRFLETRTRLNANVDKADNFLVKRFYNLDHNTYLEGALPAKNKELMGLAVSAGLRCDDCIQYHIIQSFRLGVTRPEQEEALNVALIVGGSIVIPHLRRAYELLTELYG